MLLAARLFGTLMLVIGLPCVAALARVYVRQDCLSLGYTLSVQQQRRDDLRAEIRHAELERAKGRAPAVLMEMAKRLQLGPPKVHTTPTPSDPRAHRQNSNSRGR